MGRGRGEPHKRTHDESSIPAVDIDYFFITSGGVKKWNELEQELTPAGNALVDVERAKGNMRDRRLRS